MKLGWISQPKPVGIDFFNLDYFNLKAIGGVYPLNKRPTRILILFFRIFWEFRVGMVRGYYFNISRYYSYYTNTYYSNIYYSLLFF